MLKYIIILLDDTCTSFCHYEVTRNDRKLISLEDLKKGIYFAMRENLNIQFVYPNYDLPREYYETINSIDHTNIIPASLGIDTDVVVYDTWNEVGKYNQNSDVNYVIRCSLNDLSSHCKDLLDLLGKGVRINIVLKDVKDQTPESFTQYKSLLNRITDHTKNLYGKGLSPQLNILTDRMVLEKMNNCNAGWECITLAPNGMFYTCPAFYYDNELPIGSFAEGLQIKNPQLFRLDHAPICSHCDAYQCRRCIWLNKKLTLEVNTPSREQCVLAHLERNASRELLNKVRELGEFLPGKEIEEIDYIDPFDKRDDWQM